MAEKRGFVKALSIVVFSAGLICASASRPAFSAHTVSPELSELLKRAYNQMNKGSYEPAVKTLVTAVKTDRDSISARRYLGYALLHIGAEEEALKQLALVSRMMRPAAFDSYNLGEAYFKLGKYKEAEDWFRDALGTDPQYDLARAGLIKSLAATGNYDEAYNQCQEGYKNARTEELGKYYRMMHQSVQEQRLADKYAQLEDLNSAAPPTIMDSSAPVTVGGNE